MSIENEMSVVKKVLNGEVQAFEILVLKYQSPIYNLMFRIFRDENEADDIAQEAFLKAFKKLNKFRGGRFFSWLYALSLNVARDRLRSKKKFDDLFYVPENIADYPDMTNEIKVMEDMRDAEKLYTLIENLPLGYTEPLLMRFREDLSLKEVAELTGLGLSGTKMRIQRGLAMLRKRLEEQND
ncbi:RNA polymerase sigma factor [Desulfovibrio gilichinskyi]|uniref:RNA polymerase sigma-70 factor, ECF subfamily n=1 Tax=Desulfovibrio gilichinskyi TaxID=1519643 RepID=A0A1X7CEG2_9BACT|nr:sigma-70 family RNA polymerase sigma factor [Desulfovibrio gilichinskyi]SME95214.1 RNA polymerase sigma-70 factor, ECF subfamily [Desulfovibrio gilichinskyi]